jgi:hypothetical protein
MQQSLLHNQRAVVLSKETLILSKGVSTKPAERDSFGGMNIFKRKIPIQRYISVYEILVWLVYVCIYKYSAYAGSSFLPRLRMNFPFPELILYSIATTLYVIPFYRLIGPYFLKRKWNVWLFFITLLYFIFIPKWCNYVVSYVFLETTTIRRLSSFTRKNITGIYNR